MNNRIRKTETQISIRKENLKIAFAKATGIRVELSETYEKEVDKLLTQLDHEVKLAQSEQEAFFFQIINKKYNWNETAIRDIYFRASERGITFNFKQKSSIEDYINANNMGGLRKYIASLNISDDIIEFITSDSTPISKEETIRKLHQEIKEPSRLRTARGNRNIDVYIIESIFSAYLWAIIPREKIHSFFSPNPAVNTYVENYWTFLKDKFPEKFTRNNSLNVINVDGTLVAALENSYSKLKCTVLGIIAESFKGINNHGFLSIIIDRIECDSRQYEWQLVADCILFAEKHQTEKCDNSYFKYKTICDKTRNYIPALNVEDCNFETANYGFTYRDTYIITDKEAEQKTLVLIFQANKKDEDVLPCPTCRSSTVKGNSYSSLGVKSWECGNLLCLDRSKYNRGKRYSFRSLLMQEASDEEVHAIRQEQVRRWSRDVVAGASTSEIISMLVNFYTLNGDTVKLYNLHLDEPIINGRFIQEINPILESEYTPSVDSSFFKRYVVENHPEGLQKPENIGDTNLTVYNGDSAQVLSAISPSTIDGAVTSPPYYNSREYSQWDNIYCYLYDMYLIDKQVFRVLKPGALYFYNIFDTFGNENSLALSAMGQKRMILSAYTADLFRRIGFLLLGNVAWDKGEIQGKRAFNNGNYSPFYQSPLNCWEHIWVFQKPPHPKSKPNHSAKEFRKVLREAPVFKMVKGVNTYGHSAPFPKAIPKLLLDCLTEESVILDPFAGSLTSGIAAVESGHRAICIEKSRDYCKLGLRMYAQRSFRI